MIFKQSPLNDAFKMLTKFLVLCLIFRSVHCISQYPILIVVSYDCFKYNIFDTKLVPHMEELRKQGTYADYLLNVFPTETIPNHVSIATGMYPESHGFLGSTVVVYTSVDDGLKELMDRIEPIWMLNEYQGYGRYSGAMMWPVAVLDKRITYRQAFENMNCYKKIDTVISWITNKSKPANLVMVYINELDMYGHYYGENSTQFNDMVKMLDNLTKYLQDQLELHHIADKVNVVHLSDHGLMNIKPKTFINITQYMKKGTYLWLGNSPCIQIFPFKGYKEKIYTALKYASMKNGHFKVYKREDFPKDWRYTNYRTAPPILVIADVGWAFDDMINDSRRYSKRLNMTLTNSSEFGIHGYDPSVADMRPFFMARGPRIKRHHKVPPFHTVDLFNLFTEILELPDTSNDGTLNNIMDILVDNKLNYAPRMVTAGDIVQSIKLDYDINKSSSLFDIINDGRASVPPKT